MRENKLTEMQERFVLEFTTGAGAIGNATAAAKRAGYSAKTAHEIGRQLLAKPHVMAAIHEANRRQISGPAATKASALLEEIVGNAELSMRIRLDAAKTILDRAGYVPPKATEAVEPGEKDIASMTIEELEAFIRRSEAAATAPHTRDEAEDGGGTDDPAGPDEKEAA